jgi:hypothetical protein
MTKYVDLPFNKKLNLLRGHDFSGTWPNLDHERWCLHCGQKFNGHSVRVWQDKEGRLWLECGTPGCDGSPIDWADYPWWDEKHSANKQRRRSRKKRRKSDQNLDDDIPF